MRRGETIIKRGRKRELPEKNHKENGDKRTKIKNTRQKNYSNKKIQKQKNQLQKLAKGGKWHERESQRERE